MAYFHTTVLDNQIKALPTTDTASGSIAAFNTDLTENLVSVKCQIVAKQASGTPSPDNPLPITTYSEMNFGATGKNFLNNDTSAFNIVSSNYLQAKMPSAPKIISLTDNDTSVALTGVYFGVFKAVGNSTPGYYWLVNNGTIARQSYDITDYDYITVYPKTALQTVFDRFFVQVEKGTTLTAYEPFDGTTSNIPFGQTVANGVLDITTGVLRVTSGYIASYNGETINEPWVSSIDEYVPNTSPSTGAQVVYPLVTPYDIQLDSITLQALLNENSIWCDTGDTEVKFLLTVGKKIS